MPSSNQTTLCNPSTDNKVINNSNCSVVVDFDDCESFYDSSKQTFIGIPSSEPEVSGC